MYTSQGSLAITNFVLVLLAGFYPRLLLLSQGDRSAKIRWLVISVIFIGTILAIDNGMRTYFKVEASWWNLFLWEIPTLSAYSIVNCVVGTKFDAQEDDVRYVYTERDIVYPWVKGLISAFIFVLWLAWRIFHLSFVWEDMFVTFLGRHLFW